MVDLDGRVAIVTGAGRGMGRAHALALAAAGARVVVNDLGGAVDGTGADEGPAHDVVREIEANGGKAVANNDSVADFDGARRIIATAIDTFGRLDILVNNAGIVRDRVLVNLSPDDWDAVIAVHLRGTYCPTQHAAAYWREQSKEGQTVQASVVNTTSPAGLHGNPGQANYAAAKAGIVAFTLSAAAELGRYGVRVNAISPAARTRITETVPMLADMFKAPDDPGAFDPWAPENVSPLVVYLASASCPHTGQVFGIQGNEVAQYRGWTAERRFVTEGRWSPDALAAQLDGLDPIAAGTGLHEAGGN